MAHAVIQPFRNRFGFGIDLFPLPGGFRFPDGKVEIGKGNFPLLQLGQFDPVVLHEQCLCFVRMSRFDQGFDVAELMRRDRLQFFRQFRV